MDNQNLRKTPGREINDHTNRSDDTRIASRLVSFSMNHSISQQRLIRDICRVHSPPASTTIREKRTRPTCQQNPAFALICRRDCFERPFVVSRFVLCHSHVRFQFRRRSVVEQLRSFTSKNVFLPFSKRSTPNCRFAVKSGPAFPSSSSSSSFVLVLVSRCRRRRRVAPRDSRRRRPRPRRRPSAFCRFVHTTSWRSFRRRTSLGVL